MGPMDTAATMNLNQRARAAICHDNSEAAVCYAPSKTNTFQSDNLFRLQTMYTTHANTSASTLTKTGLAK